MAAPIPLVPPVTSATRPLRSIEMAMGRQVYQNRHSK
jgi:hypothetical protein